MRHSQKARDIVLVCMLAVGILSAVIMWKNWRPSPGKPFEQVTMEQALEYMDYEEGYVLADIDPPEQFEKRHPEGAVNLPYENLGNQIISEYSDLEQQIYIVGTDSKNCEMAAYKLSSMGYVNVTQITDWA